MWPDKSTLKLLYSWNACQAPTTIEWYTANGYITKNDYKQITGKDYPQTVTQTQQ